MTYAVFINGNLIALFSTRDRAEAFIASMSRHGPAVLSSRIEQHQVDYHLDQIDRQVKRYIVYVDTYDGTIISITDTTGTDVEPDCHNGMVVWAEDESAASAIAAYNYMSGKDEL